MNPRATAADVKAMRADEAKIIYRLHYWDVLCCDDLSAGLDYAVFDYGVNSGVARASRVLQRLVGFPDDGRITGALLKAVQVKSAPDLIAHLCDERLASLKRLKTWPVFGAGWNRRVAEVRAAALVLASSSAVVGADEKTSGKGVAPVRVTPPKAVVGAVVVAGGVAAHQAQAGGRFGVLAVILAATIVLAGCGWLAWRLNQNR